MTSKLLLASAVALAFASPAFAQSPRMDPAASASATTGAMTADQVGVAPMTGTSTADYVAQAAASDKYEIEAGRVAEHKAKRKDVRQFASSMVKDHEKLTGSLTGALDNAQRKITKPSDQLPSDKQAMIDQLNNTPRGSAFDNLYLAQQLQAHQQAWALQKGYAVDGDDAVPMVESHLSAVKALQAAQ